MDPTFISLMIDLPVSVPGSRALRYKLRMHPHHGIFGTLHVLVGLGGSICVPSACYLHASCKRSGESA